MGIPLPIVQPRSCGKIKRTKSKPLCCHLVASKDKITRGPQRPSVYVAVIFVLLIGTLPVLFAQRSQARFNATADTVNLLYFTILYLTSRCSENALLAKFGISKLYFWKVGREAFPNPFGCTSRYGWLDPPLPRTIPGPGSPGGIIV